MNFTRRYDLDNIDKVMATVDEIVRATSTQPVDDTLAAPAGKCNAALWRAIDHEVATYVRSLFRDQLQRTVSATVPANVTGTPHLARADTSAHESNSPPGEDDCHLCHTCE